MFNKILVSTTLFAAVALAGVTSRTGSSAQSVSIRSTPAPTYTRFVSVDRSIAAASIVAEVEK
jgi:hypothetical protein